MRYAVVVTAAGSSCRFNNGSGLTDKKEFMPCDGHTVLYKAVQPFMQVEGLCAVVVTYKRGTGEETKSALADLSVKGVPFFFVEGGETRQQSVFNGLEKLYSLNGELELDFVCIHDGARPFVKPETIIATLDGAAKAGACAPGLKVNDTLIRTAEDGTVCERINRNGVCRIQTPQTFRFPEIYKAHFDVKNNGKEYTDDTAIYFDCGRKVLIVEGSESNTKITYRNDL